MSKRCYGLTFATVLLFLCGYGWRSLYGMRYNFFYNTALVLSILLAICLVVQLKEAEKKRAKIWVLCGFVFAGILSQWVIVINNLTCVREIYTLNYRVSEEAYFSTGYIQWDNQEYIYLGDNQVFDAHGEALISYEDYVRRFQDGHYYYEVFDESKNTVEIYRDDSLYFTYKLKDEAATFKREAPKATKFTWTSTTAAFEWSPKRNYLCINYNNNTMPEFIDIKNKTVLQAPTHENFFGPYDFEYWGRYYISQIKVRAKWNPQETLAVLYYEDAADTGSFSGCYWYLEDGSYEFYKKYDEKYEYSKPFDYYGNLTDKNVSHDYKWFDDTHAAYIGAAGADSVADAWAGKWKAGVTIKNVDTGKSKTYPAKNFACYAKDIRFGFCINPQEGIITKYRYRWI